MLSAKEEEVLVAHVITVSEWGFPFDKNDLCHLTKLYLDKSQRTVRRFKDNLPTRQWAGRFLKRHRNELTNKKCQNIKRNKAELKAEAMQLYFDNLKETLTEEDGSLVPPHRIFNYDETNLSDDPGTKRCIFKRGVKYPERIMDSSKASTSVMFCGSASGTVLAPYVVYKSKHLYSEWMKGGPEGTRYNRSKSGWFDGIVFQDWFEQTFVSHVKKHKLNEQGKVVIIGDNLSSHFSPEVLTLCDENNISFVCIPKNSTHLAQPLDVSFYGPLKKYWRGILDKWKKGLQKKSQTITKEKFPGLLNQVYVKICDENSHSAQLVAGFRKTGIFPFNPEELICRLPGTTTEIDTPSLVSESVIEMLKDLRSGQSGEKKQRSTKLNVQPGKSIGLEDLPMLLTPANHDNKAQKMRIKLRRMVKVKKTTKGNAAKGKAAKGKQTKGQSTKKRGNATKTAMKRKFAKKTACVSGSEELNVSVTKKTSNRVKRRVRNIISDSESETIEPVTETGKKKTSTKSTAPLHLIESSESDASDSETIERVTEAAEKKSGIKSAAPVVVIENSKSDARENEPIALVTETAKKKSGRKSAARKYVIERSKSHASEKVTIEPVTVAAKKKSGNKFSAPVHVIDTSKRDASEKETIEPVTYTAKKKSGKKSAAPLHVIESSENDVGKELALPVRPAVSEIRLGDFVIIEFDLGEREHYIGEVKSISRDVLSVSFLLKSRSNFTFSEDASDNVVLPTQVVKILKSPKFDHEKVIFQKPDIYGFNFV